MLLEFQIENYLSFKDNATLSMLASSSNSKEELPESIINIGKYQVLTSAAIYGANASGKSNFLKAIRFMKDFIFNSARGSQVGDKINVDKFRLNSVCDKKPSTFEMTFIVPDLSFKKKKKDIVFRYGFQVDREKVHSEWLFARFTAQESKLFTRVDDDIQIGEKYSEGKQVYTALGKIRKTSLFLSQVASIKGENAVLSNAIMNWYTRLQDISAVSDNNIMNITAEMIGEKEKKERILESLCHADICIEDLIVKKEPVDPIKIPTFIKEDLKKKFNVEALEEFHTLSISSMHKKYNKEMEEIGLESFDFEQDESDGSKKYFTLIGPVLNALRYGLVLIIDEIDARLHPTLCEQLVSIFNSKRTNKKNAQLIFSTHNTLIMNKKMLRRDQIYLTEKNKYGESELYSLLDYKKVRNDASYDKDYLLGKYGGVPFIKNFEDLLDGVNDGH